MVALTVDDAMSLRRALRNEDAAVRAELPDLVGLMLTTGCRINEALAVPRGQVDKSEVPTVSIMATSDAAERPWPGPAGASEDRRKQTQSEAACLRGGDALEEKRRAATQCARRGAGVKPVSYTHLTLPTILLV